MAGKLSRTYNSVTDHRNQALTYSATTPAPSTASPTWCARQSIDFTLPANCFTDPQHENLTYSATVVGGGSTALMASFNGVTGTLPGPCRSKRAG